MDDEFDAESEEAFSMKQFRSGIEAYMRIAEFLLLDDDTKNHMQVFLDEADDYVSMGDQVIFDD